VSAKQTPDAAERARREAAAYDEDQVWERNHAWNLRVPHILAGPNTVRGEELARALMAEALAGGGRALDVGCGDGHSSAAVLELGGSYVLGIDVAPSMIEKARQIEQPGRMEFRLVGAHEPIEGEFDLVFGRSVLHHIDFRAFLERTYADNLAPGGRMAFMEPLAHPMTLAFHRLVRSAHTPDERPLRPADLRWLRERFPLSRVVPVNLVSFPAGALSSLVFSDADNALMRAADRADRALERPRLIPFYRQGLLVVDKPRYS
jgi:SAM-dependent methyltransferase